MKSAGAGLLWAVIYIGLMIAQLWAFGEGIDVWLGWGPIAAVVIFIVLNCIPFGSLAIVVVAFIGANRGWGWYWWQALLLVAPFAVIGIAVSLGGGILSLIQGARGGPRY